jgi:hypothetical protein
MESVSNAGTFVNTVHVQNCGRILPKIHMYLLHKALRTFTVYCIIIQVFFINKL